MYPPGHIGIALAVYSPLGLYLLLRGRTRLAVTGTAAIAGLTLLPDVDKYLPWFVHRGPTHTLSFALVLGVSLAVVAAAIGGSRDRRVHNVLGLGAFGFTVGALAVLAHLLGDVITPMGIRPYEPFAGASYTFSLVFASDPTANTRLFAIGCLATITMMAFGVGFGPSSGARPVLRRALLGRSADGPEAPLRATEASNRLADTLQQSGEIDD